VVRRRHARRRDGGSTAPCEEPSEAVSTPSTKLREISTVTG
jgi:hypothetical protein